MFYVSKVLAGALSVALFAAFAAQAVGRSAPGGLGGHERLPAPLSASAFTDAVLDHNANLAAMRDTVAAASARIEPAGSLDDPMMSVLSAPRTFGASAGVGAEVEVSQALPWWGTLAARKSVARAEAQAASDDFAVLRLTVAALARGAFSDWVYLHRALDINAANQALLTELRNVARIRYATGRAPQEDVLQADVERALLKEQRLELERDEVTVRARMNALLERAAQAPIPQPMALAQPVGLPPEGMLAERALAHPELTMLEAEERTATAKADLAEKSRFPRFNLTVGYNSMWADPALRPMVGLSFTLPLDQGKYRAQIDAAQAEARRAASTLEDRRALVLSKVASAYASTRQAAQSLVLYRDELVPLARSALDVARAEYASGRGDFLNVLTAEQHRLETELGLARLQSQYFTRLAELERVSGGRLLDPLPGADSMAPDFFSAGFGPSSAIGVGGHELNAGANR